ncbi:MAG: MBL fold metallo-hydrolase, partial [Peptococcaceae bacterium]|nr:MBL fold metallo-hydrolase [Peptococcaceae bacterium]
KSLEHRVMKVPHHGSRHTLEEFLQEVDPELSVISVGKNLFGQPNPEIISLCEETGKVYRTDRHGLVVFYSDGSNIKAETYNSTTKD